MFLILQYSGYFSGHYELNVSPKPNLDTEAKIRKILKIPAEERVFLSLMDSKSYIYLFMYIQAFLFFDNNIIFMAYSEKKVIPKLSERRLSPAKIEQFARDHAAKIGPRRDGFEAEARKGGYDPNGPHPPDPQNTSVPSSKKGSKPPSPKKRSSPKKTSKRPGPITITEPAPKTGKPSKSAKVPATKGSAD